MISTALEQAIAKASTVRLHEFDRPVEEWPILAMQIPIKEWTALVDAIRAEDQP